MPFLTTRRATAAAFLFALLWSVPCSAALNGSQAYVLEVHGVRTDFAQPRLEIRDLASRPDMFNLFLQGFERFQAANSSGVASYYEIAGIHGVPYRAWQGISSSKPYSRVGYCPHYSNVFLPWHRPYLALFEQLLHRHVMDVAKDFSNTTEADQYLKTAEEIRLPYWDWALSPGSGPAVPSIMTEPTVQVRRPNNITETIPNPLYSYRFNPHNTTELWDGGHGTINQYVSTKRWPEEAATIDADSPHNVSAAEFLFNRGSSGIRDRLFNALWKNSNYSDVSHSGRGGRSDSLEAIHGWPHVTIGGYPDARNGHMFATSISAFDPSFWLHHAMMDRVIALWQRLHPETYVIPEEQSGGTFAYTKGEVLDENSPLYPFPKSQDAMWTSADARETDAFGYTYPELQLPSIENVKAAVNRLYGPAPHFGKRLQTLQRHTLDLKEDFVEFDANIVVDQLALGGSFMIYFFLGEFQQDSSLWDYDENLIGVETVWSSMPQHDDGPMGPLLISGSVPLTRGVRERWESGILDGLDEEAVVPYLKDNLHWRVRKISDGTQVPVDDIPTLRVSVVSSHVRPGQNDNELPQQISHARPHPEITWH